MTMTLAEYHDGELRIWTKGQVEPTVRIEEGSKDERDPVRDRQRADARDAGLGRRRRPGRSRAWAGCCSSVAGRSSIGSALWLLCSILRLALPGRGRGSSLLGSDSASILAVIPAAIAVLAFCRPGIVRSPSSASTKAGSSRTGFFGLRELPFEDLAEVKRLPIARRQLLKVASGRSGSRPEDDHCSIPKPTDEALETIRRLRPGRRSRSG